jgi:hypothetical protein
MKFPLLSKASPNLDTTIRDELLIAGIAPHTLPLIPQHLAVPTHVQGFVGSWVFTRAWSYWMASGPGIPTTAALELHANFSDSVRVHGHAASPSPLVQSQGLGVNSYHVDDVLGLQALVGVLNRALEVPQTCTFRQLAIGARFKYPEGKKIWVKLNGGGIAEWQDSLATGSWVGQAIGIFSDPLQPDAPVIFLG